jgi:phosphoglycolate phosphatase-like HAD superfamily hydrolase
MSEEAGMAHARSTSTTPSRRSRTLAKGHGPERSSRTRPAPPLARKASGFRHGAQRTPGHSAHCVIFDVEGTLVDCAIQVTESWRLALQDFGYELSHAALHRYSGMDADDMLSLLLPAASKDDKDRLKRDQSERYRRMFLPNVLPFPGARFVFEQLKDAGHLIGVATTCASDELAVYLELIGSRHLIDAIACGDDGTPGKPHPDLYKIALGRLGGRKNATAVGDSPYDAIAASRAGIRAIGTVGGGFLPSELKDAGCRAVVRDLPEVIELIALK